jgi:hypothetical protein
MRSFKKIGVLTTVLCGLTAGVTIASTVWDPAGNGVSPPATGDWGEALNWSAGVPGVPDAKAVFNVANAADAVVADSQTGCWLVQGDNADGGKIIIANGGSLDVSAANAWSSVGYNSTAYMNVEAGGTMTFNQAWIGFTAGGVGTVDISGTVHVNDMFGLGWSGGDGYVNVLDGGLLALSNIHSDGSTSIKQNSILDLRGTGQVTLPGNFTSVIAAYVANGLITGDGVVGNVITDLTTNPGFTTAMAEDSEPPEPPDGPQITIRSLGGSDLELSWPKEVGPYEPATTGELGGSNAWTAVSGPITINSNEYTKIVMADNPSAFYRLYLAAVDNTTLSNKSMMGYQGWFTAPGDGTPVNDRWHHWALNNEGYPNINNWGIDFYPDMSEYSPEELYEPGWTLNNGDTAYLYSAAHPKSVDRHCRWMWEYGIDGVFLQRFLGELGDSRFFTMRNMVTENIRAGCEAHGRLYAIMYDVSGVSDADMLGKLTNDWNYLVGTLDVTNSPSYARHNGKPVVSIWGLGFKGRGLTPATATAIINYFKGQGMTVKGGVPDSWRTLDGDSETDPAWAAVYRSFDIISPWTVGRYNSIYGANVWRVNKIVPDLDAATAAGADYMPVIFPGFSWYNIHGGPLNQISRLGGDFYWRQAYNSQVSGCSMLYTAMFDEVDEGTAMYKMAATTNELPAGATMVPLDVDGIALPSDWYLQVGGAAARMLRGEIPLQSTLPISP